MTRKKRIFINGRFLTQLPTGVQKFAIGISQHLQELEPSILVLIPPGCPPFTGLVCRKIGFLRGNSWEQLCLAAFMLLHPGSVLLNLCNTAPLLIHRQYVTVHDLAFTRNRTWFTKKFRAWYRFLLPKIIRKARGIFTVSDFTKKEIISMYHTPPEKIKVVYNGTRMETASGPPFIPGKYLLLLDVFNPRKQAATVFSILPFIRSNGYSLVTTGERKSIYASLPEIHQEGVIHLGFVEDKLYYNLMRHARALIYPTAYEGFGVPVLESILSGTCPLVSELEVFKESFGALPLYFQDEGGLKAAIGKVESWSVPKEETEKLLKKYNFASSAQEILLKMRSKN